MCSIRIESPLICGAVHRCATFVFSPLSSVERVIVVPHSYRVPCHRWSGSYVCRFDIESISPHPDARHFAEDIAQFEMFDWKEIELCCVSDRYKETNKIKH